MLKTEIIKFCNQTEKQSNSFSISFLGNISVKSRDGAPSSLVPFSSVYLFTSASYHEQSLHHFRHIIFILILSSRSMSSPSSHVAHQCHPRSQFRPIFRQRNTISSNTNVWIFCELVMLSVLSFFFR